MPILKKPYSKVDDVFSNFNKLYGETTDAQKQRYQNTFESFKNYFNEENAYIASSSGRVEVCGNHTDHNGGKVVSCAISLDTLAMFLPTDDQVITIKSEGYEEIVVAINEEEKEKIGTSDALVRGVVVGLQKRNYNVGGFKAYLTSNVLGGAGISSSASFEVLIAEILNFLYNDGRISNEEKATVAQFSENVYFGKPCGLLDQTAIAYGGLNKLDFATKGKIVVEKINNNLEDYTFVLINTGGSHADLTDEYASIPVEMYAVAKEFNKERLVELSKEEFLSGLPSVANKLSDRAVLRAFHFYEENERVEKLYASLIANDEDSFLLAIKESGLSSLWKLQNCFVAGSKEQLIPKAISIASPYLKGGVSRVHGGGFAGSVLNVIKSSNLEEFINHMSNFYEKKNIIPLKIRSVGTIVL